MRGPAGVVVAGASVEIRGPLGSRSTVSADDGSFEIARIVPGAYALFAHGHGGLEAAVDDLRVPLGRTVRVEISLAPPVATEITVVASPTLLDTVSAAATTMLERRELDRAPADRDFLSVLAQLRGVAWEPEAAGISIDGSSGAENRVFVDGIDVTSPQKGTPAKDLPVAFAGEIQVKSAGYAAEYGGSTGGVVNVVTRAGGNDVHAAFGARYESSALAGDTRPTLTVDESGREAEYVRYRADDVASVDPSLSASGPIVTDRAWFFVGYEERFGATERTVDFFDGTRGSFDSNRRDRFLAATVTAAWGRGFLLKAAAHASPSGVERSLPGPEGRGSSDPADYAPGEERENDAAAVHFDWLPGERWLLSARATRFRTNFRTTEIERGEPAKHFTNASPGVFPEAPPELVRPVGFSTGPHYELWDHDEYRRTAYGIDAAREVDGWGRHTVKAGVQSERIENSVLRDVSATTLEFQWATGDVIVGERAHGRYGALAVYRYQTAGEVETDNTAVFLQDTWRPRANLTFELGLRAEREEVPDYRIGHDGESAIEFDLDDKLAPRLGFAWDPGGEGTTRVYGSYGRYFDVTKYELARLSFGSERRVRYVYQLNTLDWPSVTCEIVVNDPARPPDCGAGAPFVSVVDLRIPSNDAIDPDLRPTEAAEWQLGVERRVGRRSVVGLRYLHKELLRVIEDIGAYAEGVGEVYVIGNPGEGASRFAVPGVALPKPVRDYDALELTFQRRLEDGWSLQASYVYSRLRGNFPGLASSDEDGRASPNVLRAYDAWFNLFGQDGRPVEGPLGTDRPHQLELTGTYSAPFGTTVGLYQYLGSGTPRTTRASRNHVAFFPYGRGDRGRNPTLTQTDLRVAHELRLHQGTLELAVTVLNLFDEDTVLDVSEELHGSSLALTDAEFLAGFDVEEEIDAQGLPRRPTFGLPSRFQSPRRVLFSAQLAF